MKKQISVPLALAIIVAYSVTTTFLFFYYGLPSLEGKIPQQMYADSVTYEQAAEFLAVGDELVSIGGNYLGPVLVLRVFSSDRILIYFFNLSLLFLSGTIAFKYLNINRSIFMLAILSSPLLLFSTFGVNKEIFLLPFSICLLLFMQRRTAIWLSCAVLSGLFVRWQIVVFVALVLLVTSQINPLRKNRLETLVVLIAALSIAYPLFASEALESIEQISIEGAREEAGSQASGIYSKMQEIQRSYGYFLVVIPKTIQLLVGFLSRFSFAEIELNFWNNFVIMSQCLHNLILLGAAIVYKKFDLSENCFFLICIFAVMFAVTPVFAPRYFYPIAIWLAIWLASANVNSVSQKNQCTSRQEEAAID
jgi:hypothetical protein